MINRIYQIFNSLTKTEKRAFWCFCVTGITSGVILALLVFQSATIEVPEPSSGYREGIVGQPIAINPLLSGTNDADRDLAELIFSDILDLAESYKTSPDGQTWNILLKTDLRWSDGKPLTSDDVIFTIDTIQNSESRSPLFLTWQGVVINRISEREVEFTLRTPYAFFLDNLRDLKIIPRHIFGTIPPENFRLSNFNLEPVGSGPYTFDSFEKRKDGFITDYHLITNDYFSGAAPFIKNFDIKFYGTSAELLDAFNTKKIDGFGGLNPKNIGDLKLSHAILEKTIPRYYSIFINKNTKSGLSDKDVITAINYSINKKQIVDEVFDGKAMIINGPILPVIGGYDQATDPGNTVDLQKANEILDQKKWLRNETTGIREKKIGKQMESLSFSIIVPQIPFLTDTIGKIQEMLSVIGVKLNPVFLNPTDVINEVVKTRNYEMIIFGNVLRNNPDIFSFWHSSERFYPGLNLALYDNKKVDALLESIRTNSDETKRNEELFQLQKMIIQDQPAIFLYSPTYLYVGPKNLGGFEEKTIATPSDRFESVNLWYLETTRVFK